MKNWRSAGVALSASPSNRRRQTGSPACCLRTGDHTTLSDAKGCSRWGSVPGHAFLDAVRWRAESGQRRQKNKGEKKTHEFSLETVVHVRSQTNDPIAVTFRRGETTMTRTTQNRLPSKTASAPKKQTAAKRKAPKTDGSGVKNGRTRSKAARHQSAGHRSQPASAPPPGNFFESGVFCFFPRSQ